VSSLPWFKFYSRTWSGNQRLRMVSLAARGLWVEMLSLMHEAEPYGYLVVNGKPISVQQLARAVSVADAEVEVLLQELKGAGILHIDRRKRIYSPRMIRERSLSEKGRNAANHRYNQIIDLKREIDTPSGLPTGLPTAKKKESRGEKADHREEPVGSSSPTLIPEGWSPSPETAARAIEIRPDLGAVGMATEMERFRNYWRSNGTHQALKRDWNAAWLYWLSSKPGVNVQPAAKTEQTFPTVRLHRTMDAELFKACEDIQGKPAATDSDWAFPQDVVEQARTHLLGRPWTRGSP
jgi:DNA-binding transcriptional ArsR family regulator